MENELRDTRPIALLPPAEVWDRIEPLAPDLGADPEIAGLGALPYSQLRGPGFERLCYELLVAEGHTPRFFGRSGQRDYGVDIILEAGDTRTVYQCKNLAEAPTWTQVRDAVITFETDWLEEAGLPSPKGYVYCCPQPLDDNTLGKAWTKFRDAFLARTGVEVSFWDRHSLDTRLRGKPDVVAGLFSDSYAEHFCTSDEWMDDPWTRVRWGHARHASIQRFLVRHRSGLIHVADQDADRFVDTLSAAPILAIRGMPGAGKTSTGLELACRLATPRRRIYYATLKDGQEFQRLWQSVRRRHSLPSLFLLDDCHWDLKKTGDFLDRLMPELKATHGNVRILLVMRDLPGSSGGLDDTPDWLARLEQDGQILDLNTNLERTRAVTVHLLPKLVGLSKQRMERLHHRSGGDLLLLDEILADIASPSDLDDLQSDRLYGSLRTRYFEENRRLPTVVRLACLAQYDLLPLASFLDGGWQAGEKALVVPLMTELFAPPRYQFLHASMAELLLRALLSLEAQAEFVEERVSQSTANEIITYLHHLLAAGDDGFGFMASIQMLLRSQLKLMDRVLEARIKAEVLADKTIHAGIDANLDRSTFTFLHVCLAVLTFAEHPARERYVSTATDRDGIRSLDDQAA